MRLLGAELRGLRRGGLRLLTPPAEPAAPGPAAPGPATARPAAVDVAVVGYGPVGALAALLLGRAGLTCVVVDRREAVHALPRAVAADDEVLRLLAAAGLGGAVAGMVAVPGARFLGRRGQVVLEVDFDGAPNAQPGLALFRQPDLERALRAEVARLPTVRTVLGRGVGGLAQDAAGVVLALDGGLQVRARYVLGCDGANSTVRDLVGVAVRGSGASQRWLVVDVATGDPHRTPDRPTYGCDPDRTWVQMPTPGGRRFEFLLPGDEPPPALDGLLAPHLTGTPARVERAVTYTYRVSRARRWRAGRVLLAGDAAHTMPPFAGQGLAAGLRDVADLAWRLPLVVQGVAAPALLDGYERERGPHVGRMTRLSRLAGAVVTTRSRRAADARDAALRAGARTPLLGAWLRSGGPRPRQVLAARSTHLRAALPVRRLRPAGLLPAVRVRRPGAPGLEPLDAHLHGRFTLLGLGVDPTAALPADARARWEALGGQALAVVPAGAAGPADVAVVEDADGALLRVGPGRVAAVRPDGQVLALVAPQAAGRVVHRVARYLRGGP